MVSFASSACMLTTAFYHQINPDNLEIHPGGKIALQAARFLASSFTVPALFILN